MHNRFFENKTTNMMPTKVIGIGWDVGGWMGNNHGIAICVWDRITNTVDWIGVPNEIAIPSSGISFHHLIHAVDPTFTFDKHSLLIIGIDAPLGYPKTFTRFINGESISLEKPDREIENPLAYRYTDQVIYEKFGKKPLSATFDRIGNNSTVAIYHARKWQKENNFKVYPMGKPDKEDQKMMIEVYPALVKASKTSEADTFLNKYLPSNVQPGTDAYDACICALYAIAFGTNGLLLPALAHPSEHAKKLAKEEGWIYYLEKR
ncbi:DUF429 domain-containing protein [Salicibibacter cibi]|uniref:DUF429 domain-containing protein n=1 Tax=Salicibibacter cibi TaxID=2743001 RepID=A0A7T6ZB38_9BACI|nr:DUF429 domain-containing protein [Salicibibacter cibi]QQK80005.1 DUF429 domain-containing protein [Salicibibacter cibi]